MTTYPRVLPVGDAAATVELGDKIDLELNARVRALDRSLAERPFDGIVECVPTYRSLLVRFDPGRTSFEDARAILRDRAAVIGRVEAPGPIRTIPAVYGGADGPDLASVAEACGLDEARVVELHTSCEYTAFMLGFMPGFAYLGSLPEALALPRRTTPRVRVPAGSVAIAGRQTGIYPRSSPGGWHLIARTARRLFDPTASSPALIEPGDRVRFVRVDALQDEDARVALSKRSSDAEIEVVAPGLLTTVQDAGRVGHRRLGVAQAGPMDRGAHAAANGAVGNDPGAAALEATIDGPVLRFQRGTWVAIAGADLGAVLERADLGPWQVPLARAFLARSGNVLRFTGRRQGCRASIAFAGGIDVPLALGSRATDLSGGFGGFSGRRLLAGDVLCLGPSAGPDAAATLQAGPPPSGEAPDAVTTLRVVLGPQADHFDSAARQRFLSDVFAISPTSDRVGYRLAGTPVEMSGPAEIISDGMVPGSIQVPPDGQPIVMLADGPTTGGYPKIATVITADLDRLAQLVPGEGRVRFVSLA